MGSVTIVAFFVLIETYRNGQLEGDVEWRQWTQSRVADTTVALLEDGVSNNYEKQNISFLSRWRVHARAVRFSGHSAWRNLG